ncbi:MAG: putative porin [Tannerellaceae bacterium]|jgi:hypothetical protein|nr:putative porin [Tannerellaceae bacterium]
MRTHISFLLLLLAFPAFAQDKASARSSRRNVLESLAKPQAMQPDSLAEVDSALLKSKRLIAWKLTEDLGEPYMAAQDSGYLNYGNSTLVEAQSLALGYVGNVGSPAQTKIFFDRKEARDFTFADPYDYYITTPVNAAFYDTKIPYTNAYYSQAGGGADREDRIGGILTWNIGKRLNLGAETDYIYGRGLYQSIGTKLLSYRIFGSYRTERYELNAYLSNFNFVNAENGGLTNDRYITNPEEFIVGRQEVPRKEYPVRMTGTWNRVRGKQYFLTHRYNLGFVRTTEADTITGREASEVFVPVSAIIHTFEYEDFFRRFISDLDPAAIDPVYLIPSAGSDYNPDRQRLRYVYGIDESLNDVASSWQVANTLALAMREGFSDWAKFGLTAFARFENRRFRLPVRIPGLRYDETDGSGPAPQPDRLDYPIDENHSEFSTFLGAELAKRRGTILTYDARGELCMIGSDLGEFRFTGQLQTTFPLFGREAAVSAGGYLKNIRPAFFHRYHHSRYFWWDPLTRPLGNMQQLRLEGKVQLDYTHTTLAAGIESIQKHIYFNTKGLPEQHDGNIQVVSARLEQNIYHRSFGWENRIAFQTSSSDVLPLPQLSAYTNLYVGFKLAKVLSIQTGVSALYHTRYYAPYYEPATQQFILQTEKEIGHYPLINAYFNFHLKQARFFAMAYNLGSTFIKEPAYFSMLHYPMNPMVIKLGVSVVFNN